MTSPQAPQADEMTLLQARLAEAEETLRAIRHGEIDALVVDGPGGSQVYTLRGADEPYRHLVEQMQEGALVLTSGGDILYANARFAALVGAPLESIVGGRISRFINESDRTDLETLLRARTGRRHCRLIRSDSGDVEVSLSLTTIGDRLNLVVTDLSDLLEAKHERELAERHTRKKDEFLAMLAHELRNPLAAISNAVRMLGLARGGVESTIAAEGLIARQVSHITFLINELLDVERVVSGRMRLNPQPCNLEEAVQRVVGGFTANVRLDRDVEIFTEPVWIDGDPVRLEQILTNIMTNAVKYTSQGGRIRVVLRADHDDAVFSVEDTGVGISPSLLPHVFDLYVQGERTLDRAAGGLGIGLTLVRHLVELHGGTVEASSEGEGHGSQFTVRLTRIAAPAKSSVRTGLQDRRTTPRRVLLIEDNDDARQMLRLILELAGHVVYDAPDSAAGLELINAVHPDVGIIDIGLPIMDGYAVARRIRETPNGRGMLLLALSGLDADRRQPRSREDGFDYHLVKPVDPDRLARLVAEGAEAS